MAMKTKYNDRGWPIVDNQIKTTRSPLVGFEWEVPILYGDFTKNQLKEIELHSGDDGPDGIDEYIGDSGPFGIHRFSVANGFSYHCECGGLEFASPITNTIAVARRSAESLKRFAQSKNFLDPSGVVSECGIHVHVSYPDVPVHQLKDNYFPLVNGMLNRESSAKFMWHFSHRENSDSYYYTDQGRSSEWDTDDNENYDMYDVQNGFTNEMLRRNYHGTIEFRVWHSDEKLLIPALEFAHSVLKFVRDKKYTGEAKSIPYLKDYKKWLFKQKGYKVLKGFANWSLIND